MQQSAKLQQQHEAELLNADPYNIEAQRKIEEAIRQEAVLENMESAMENMPEAFGSVHMLYVDTEVNGHKVKAFVDSGAQATISEFWLWWSRPRVCADVALLSRSVSRLRGAMWGHASARHSLRRYGARSRHGQDPRSSAQRADQDGQRSLPAVQFHHHGGASAYNALFLGRAIFGLTSAELTTTFPSQGKDVELLFGLDMLKRHQACIDLAKDALVIQGREIRFLSEHELPKSFGMAEEDELDE